MLYLELQRRLRGWKQIAFAEMVGFSAEYVSNVERGWLRPSAHFKQRCARVFRLPAELLFSPLDSPKGGKVLAD